MANNIITRGTGYYLPIAVQVDGALADLNTDWQVLAIALSVRDGDTVKIFHETADDTYGQFVVSGTTVGQVSPKLTPDITKLLEAGQKVYFTVKIQNRLDSFTTLQPETIDFIIEDSPLADE